MRRVHLTPQARVQAREAAVWWARHRTSAPLVFLKELTDAVDRVRRSPRAGRVYARTSQVEVRRVLLRVTRFHVYYFDDKPRNSVIVLAVWSAVRSRNPLLD